MSVAGPPRPRPDLRIAGARFFREAARNVLVVPKCLACERTFWHPRPRCPHCGSDRVDWIESAGHGTIHTFTVVRQSNDAFFATQVPYAVAIIELDEGVRLMSNVVQTPLDAIQIGMRVDVVFELAGGIGIPMFRGQRT